MGLLFLCTYIFAISLSYSFMVCSLSYTPLIVETILLFVPFPGNIKFLPLSPCSVIGCCNFISQSDPTRGRLPLFYMWYTASSIFEYQNWHKNTSRYTAARFFSIVNNTQYVWKVLYTLMREKNNSQILPSCELHKTQKQ